MVCITGVDARSISAANVTRSTDELGQHNHSVGLQGTLRMYRPYGEKSEITSMAYG